MKSRLRLAAWVAFSFVQMAPGDAKAYTPQLFDPAQDTGQDFTATTGWNKAVWTNTYGNGYWFSGSPNGVLMTMGGSTAPSWQNTAFMQTVGAGLCAGGFGYGTFHIRGGIPAGNKNQSPGVNFILWRMDDQWITPTLGNIVTEDDIMEAWSLNGTGTATLHYYDATKKNGGTNGQAMTGLGDVTGLHDYDEVWGPGFLALFKDGAKLRELDGAQVPTDFAHGGCNYSLGAQVINPSGYAQTGLPTVQMYVGGAWHSAALTPPAGSADTITAASSSGTPAPVPPVTTPTSPVTTPTSPVTTPAAPVTDPAPPVTTPPVTVPVVPVVPAVPAVPVTPPPAPATLSASATVTGGNLALTVTKATGSPATLRWSEDGKYQGVLGDGFIDRTKVFTLPLPAPGAHSVALTLDGSSLTAQAPFTVPVPPPPAYSLGTLQGAVAAALSSGQPSAQILGTIQADFALYQAANPGQ